MSVTQKCRDRTVNIISSFREDGWLVSILAAITIPIFSIVRFVSFNEGVIRIFFGGEFVGCTAPFIRNTCDVKFSDHCFIILRPRFTAVHKVLPVLTYDEDLTYIVKEMRIMLTYPIDSDCLIEFKYIQQNWSRPCPRGC